MSISDSNIQNAYALAKERYAALGVNTETAIAKLEKVAISLHCWQGDDVGGFENPGGDLTGGIAATGNYPGKARTADELRNDLDVVYSLLPGSHRLNLHAIYLEADEKVERNAIEPRSRGVSMAMRGEAARTSSREVTPGRAIGALGVGAEPGTGRPSGPGVGAPPG